MSHWYFHVFITRHIDTDPDPVFPPRLYRIREVGLLAKHTRIYIPSKPECLSNSYVFSVGMEYTAPIFLFMACSITVSMIVLFGEMIHHRCVRMRFERPKQQQKQMKKIFNSN